MKTKILITAINSPPGRSVYTSLKKNKSLELICIDSDKDSVFNLLRKKNFFICPAANKKNYKRFIDKIIKKKKIKIIIPCIEPEVLFFSKKFLDYKKKIKILVPELKELNRIINKFNLFNLCKKLKIKVPDTEKIEFPRDGKKKININFPIIIKPIVGWGMNNIRIIKDKNQFSKLTSDLKGQFIIQKYLGDYDKNVYAVCLLIDNNGKEKLNFVSKSILTKYKNGGPATAGIEVESQFLLKIARKLISSLNGFYGPAMVEFIRTKGKNNFSLIDFNARIWGYSQLADFNGKNFPQGIVDLLLGKKIKTNNRNKKKFIMIRDFIDLKVKKNKVC